MTLQAAIPEWIWRRYEVGERLGGGVWSDVYRVTARGTGEVFAVKILKPEYRSAEKLRSRFLSEAKAMARLVHPNVLRIFDVGGAMTEEPAIVMEYATGGDLREYVTLYGLEAGQIARMALFMLLGLVAAQKVGIVHRGLCPESVFLDDNLSPKLADFGTVLMEQNPHLPTLPAESLGEFLYSPPEQRYDPRGVDGRVDIYAMGAMLCFMCMRRDPPDLSLLSRSPEMLDLVHPMLRPIITRACQPRPEDRYQTAAEMGRAVRKLFVNG